MSLTTPAARQRPSSSPAIRRSMTPARSRAPEAIKSAAGAANPNAVVADQRPEKRRRRGPREQGQSQRALSRSGRSEDQHPVFAVDHGRCVQARPSDASPSCRQRRQFDDETRAGAVPDRLVRHRRIAVRDPHGRGLSGTIGGPDPSAVRLDDLTRDRQSQAGVLAEPLTWPVGVESLENSLERVRGDAWPVVVDGDDDTVLGRLSVLLASEIPLERHAHDAAGL